MQRAADDRRDGQHRAPVRVFHPKQLNLRRKLHAALQLHAPLDHRAVAETYAVPDDTPRLDPRAFSEVAPRPDDASVPDHRARVKVAVRADLAVRPDVGRAQQAARAENQPRMPAHIHPPEVALSQAVLAIRPGFKQIKFVLHPNLHASFAPSASRSAGRRTASAIRPPRSLSRSLYRRRTACIFCRSSSLTPESDAPACRFS